LVDQPKKTELESAPPASQNGGFGGAINKSGEGQASNAVMAVL